MSFDLAPLWSLAELINTPTPPQGELVSLDRIQGGTGRLNNEESSSTAEGRAFKAGDVLFGKLRPYLAKYWLADKDGTAQGDIHIYHPSSETDPRFLAYLVGSNEFVRLADAASTGTKMPRVEWSKIAQFQVPAPARTAQHAIADYLDRETAEIDGMRADLDEMERLLSERRVSIVQRHVLPKDGTYTRIKLVADVSLGKTVQKTQKDSAEVLRHYVRAAHIQPHGRLVLDDQAMWFAPNELKQLTLEAGDVLVG